MSAVALRPQEVERRRAALHRHLRNSALTAPNAAVAGVFSTPAAGLTPGASKLPPGHTPAAFLPGMYCVVSYSFAKKWADERGLLEPRKALDLRRANVVRKELGLAPFALRGDC